MRKFDHDGLLLAEYQGHLFEKSTELNCSTSIFLRRFIHSDLLVALDCNTPSYITLDTKYGISCIIEQFGDSDYGREKYSKSALFWIGYMYKYISYTREHSTKFVMKTFSSKQMNEVYYTFHTQAPEWCVKNLLEINNLTEKYFDKNYRLKQIIQKSRR